MRVPARMTVMGALDSCARVGVESRMAAQSESKARFSERMRFLRGRGGSLPQEGGFGKETRSILGIWECGRTHPPGVFAQGCESKRVERARSLRM